MYDEYECIIPIKYLAGKTENILNENKKKKKNWS